MKYDAVILTHLSVAPMTKTLGPYRVADSLRRMGLLVQVVGATNTFSEAELQQVLLSFIDENTKIIGISTTFFQLVDVKNIHKYFPESVPEFILKVLAEIKRLYPQIKIICGGSFSHLQIGNDLFDAVFHGYSDNAIQEYARSLTGGKKHLWKTHLNTKIIEGEAYPVDMEELRHQWQDNDIIFPGETLPIEIGRGCIFKCKFCNFQLTGKKKLDYLRNYDHLREEFLQNYEKYGVTNYSFSDDTFNDSTYKLEKIFQITSNLPFKINFTSYLRLDLLYAHREQIELLKEIGLRSAYFGIESFNPRSAKIIGKGLASDKVKDFLLDLSENHFNKDRNFVCSFIVGLPYETIAQVEESFKWCQEHDINSVWSPLFIRPDARYKSDIDIYYEKYGYKINDDSYEWTNENTTRSECFGMAARFNSERNNTLHTWPLFDGASLKIGSWDEMMKMRMNDLMVNPEIYSKINQRIHQYKEKLKELGERHEGN